jgi:DNA processing protein
MSKKVKEFDTLDILMHAIGLESGFSSTKYCRIFKQYSENTISREDLEASIRLPSDDFWSQAESELKQASELGIECISITSEEYPPALYEIDDPPLVIFVSSKADWKKTQAVKNRMFAIVGSRKITPYGLSVTREISRAVAEAGFTVVSGLAYGVDKSAHEGALSAGSDVPTIAVLGSGLLEVYPAAHRNLVCRIVEEGGCVISEYGLYREPRGYLFPRRNRIISGLSFGVLVVEAKEKSGSLITARFAMEQGRDVYAIPGAIDAPCSAGCNKLLSEGAMPVLSVSHLLESLDDSPPGSKTRSKKAKVSPLSSGIRVLNNKNDSAPVRALTERESFLLQTIKTGTDTIDEILDSGLFAESELRSLLLSLEMSDFIQEVSGSYIVIR